MPQNSTSLRKFKVQNPKIHHSKDSINRLKRAAGHLKKVIQMLEHEESCGDVLQQLSAVISALGSSRVQILNAHLNSCLKPVLKSKDVKLVREIEIMIQKGMKV